MSCGCRCHAGGAHVECDRGDVQPGGAMSCTASHYATEDKPLAATVPEGDYCERCGAIGDTQHAWQEGDCVLPHDEHSTDLEPGTFVCKPCVKRWRRWLVEIEELWQTIADVIVAGSVPDDTAEHKRTKITGSPSPLRLSAWALAHPDDLNVVILDDNGQPKHTHMTGMPDVRAILAQWAEALWDAHAWGNDWPTSVTGAVAAIECNLGTLAALPDVDTFDAELRWLRRHLRAAHGITDPQPLCRCLSVGCRGMVWRNHICDHCGRKYGKLDLVRAKGHDKREASA